MKQTLASQVLDLPVDDIAPECNDRTAFADGPLAELAASIAQHGLAQPITVRVNPAGGFLLVAGERRWRAHRLNGASTIRAIVADLTDEEAADVMLLENLNREDLNPLDEARAYSSRMARFGYTAEQVAARASVSPGVVRARLALLDLAPRVQVLIAAGGFFLAGAAQIAGLDNNRQILAVNTFITDPKMSGATWDALVRRLREEQNDECSMFDPDDFMVVAEYHEQARAAARPPARKLAELLAAAMAHVPDGADRAAMLAACAAYGVAAEVAA